MAIRYDDAFNWTGESELLTDCRLYLRDLCGLNPSEVRRSMYVPSMTQTDYIYINLFMCSVLWPESTSHPRYVQYD